MIRTAKAFPRGFSTKKWAPICLNFVLTHSFHDWSVNTEVFRQDFLHLARQANVRHVGFLRHGNTLPSQNGVDFERLLSEKGREQANEAGSSFGLELKPFYGKLLVSPAPRTTETAKIFLNASEETETVLVKPLDVLYDGTMQPEGSAIFKKIGYAPLEDYVNNKIKEDRENMRRILALYAQNVIKEIMNTFTADISSLKDSPSRPHEPTTLWIVGHAIYLPSAVLGVAEAVGCSSSSKDLILSTVTQEAEGYLVDVEKAKTSYLARPSSST